MLPTIRGEGRLVGAPGSATMSGHPPNLGNGSERLSESERLLAAAEAVAAGRFDAALRLLAPLAEDAAGRDRLLGAAYLGRKNAKAALAHLGRAAAAGDDSEIGLLLGRAHLLANDAGAAVAVFERLAPSAAVATALAGAYRRDARYADAVRVAEAAVDPGDQLLYEKALAQAALGDAVGSLATWDTLLVRAPDLAAAWYGSHGPALDRHGWAEAERRLLRAAACPKANGKYAALLAAHDTLAGRPPRPFGRRHAHVVEGAAALLPDLAPDWRLFGGTLALLDWALGQAVRPGLVLEFGVRRGTSLAAIAAAAGQEVHGFDSFEGLPEAWSGTPQGVLTTGGVPPAAAANIRLHPGWFADTLPGFLAAHPEPVRFVNIDSDLYSSAKTVLTALAGRIGSGTVLVFDEFIGNRSWRDDEYRAFAEFVAATGVGYRVIAVNPAGKQVALAVTG